MLFSKQRAEEITTQFQIGESIKPSGESWNEDDLLQVAAAALVAITQRTLGRNMGQTDEHLEAAAQTKYDDLFTAVEFFADLTARASFGRYDEQFAPLVQAELVSDGDTRAIRIVSGEHESGDDRNGADT